MPPKLPLISNQKCEFGTNRHLPSLALTKKNVAQHIISLLVYLLTTNNMLTFASEKPIIN
jgi:hypothetical protein